MTNRKWTILTLSMLAALVVSLIVIVNFIIDPYGEFRLIEGNYNKLKLKAEKTTALQVASKLNDGKYALVFGSSRTMLLSSEIMGEPILNFSTSIYNNPGDILALLKMLTKKQLANITNIYFLVDINGFHYTATAPEMSSRSRLFLETLRNIGPKKIEDAWDCLVANSKQYGTENFPNNIDSYGTLHKVEKPFHAKDPFFSSHFVTPYYLKSLRNISIFGKQNKIKTLYFTTPWFQPFVQEQQNKINSILDKAALASGGLLNFQLRTNLTGNSTLFYDPSHLNKKGLINFIKILNLAASPSIPDSFSILQANVDYKNITFKDLKKEIYEKNSPQINSFFFPTLLQAGRKDLFLNFYDNAQSFHITKKGIITDAFVLAQPEQLKILLENGRDLSQYINFGLFKAIMSGNLGMVKNAILLGADINNIGPQDVTPLQRAIMFSPDINIIKLLLDSGASPNYINTTTTYTKYLYDSPFTLALRCKNQDIFNYLVSRFPQSPLAQHASLLKKLQKDPNNSELYNNCLKLHKKYYKSDNLITGVVVRLINNKNYLKSENGITILHLGTDKYKLTKIEEYLFRNFETGQRIELLVTKTFTHLTNREVSKSAEDTAILNKIIQELNLIIPILIKNKAIKILY